MNENRVSSMDELEQNIMGLEMAWCRDVKVMASWLGTMIENRVLDRIVGVHN